MQYIMKEIITKTVNGGVVIVNKRLRLNLFWIKAKRKSLGLTHQQLAEQLSFKNASTYFKYENGTYAFKADHLPRLAEALECDMKDLFSTGDEMNRRK